MTVKSKIVLSEARHLLVKWCERNLFSLSDLSFDHKYILNHCIIIQTLPSSTIIVLRSYRLSLL